MLKVALRSRKIAPNATVEKEELLTSGTRIGGGARLIGYVKTGGDVVIDCNALVYGPVSLGRGTYIGPHCVIGFPDSEEIVKLMNSDLTVHKKKPTTLGRECIVRSGTTLYSNVKVADKVAFGHNVMVREAVTIGELTKVGTNVVVDGKTSIGARVSIQTGVYICTYSKIEDGVFLGPCCVLTNDKYVEQKAFKLVGPTVKKGASIGANALIFPGITVGEGAVVGAQALVTSHVPPRTIFAGIPARKLRGLPKDWHSRLLGI